MGKTLYDQDWYSHEHLIALETYLGDQFACATASVQSAVQACLELVGTRSSIIPVILPVTAPPDTLAGVLRAGAHPLLLDIDEETLQIDAIQLEEAIHSLVEEGNTPIVLFTRPFGASISPELLALVEDLPTILDSRLMPSSNIETWDLPCVFNIFDLSPICGSGALILHKFAAQVEQLRQVRSGPMGLAAALPELQAKVALEAVKSFTTREHDYKKAIAALGGSEEVCGPCRYPTLVWLKVPDAEKLATDLAKQGIEAVLGVCPLYGLEEVRKRYQEPPEYPVASKVTNKYVCVPADIEVSKKVLELL